MAAKGKPKVSLETKKAAFALRLQGLMNKEIAERLHIHPVTVSKMFKTLRQLEAAGVVTKQPKEARSDADILVDWKHRLTKKSVKALDRGLDDTTDNYMAGGLGRDVLKGLGELAGDSVNVHMQTLIATMPPEFRDRYFPETDQPRPEPEPLSTEAHECLGLQVFKESNCTPEEFQRLRREAREGRMRLVTNDEPWERFFESEEARARAGVNK